MRTQTRLGNRFVCCRPGAQAPRLQVSAHAMPMSMNQKASRVRPSSLQARPRGCVLVNLSMKTDTRLDENRFVRCSSGSSSPCSRWPLIDSSPSLSSPPASPPASRHPAGLPRLVSFSRSGCLPAPGSRLPCFDPPLHLAWFRAKLKVLEGEALGCFLCLPCTPTRGLRCLLSLGFVCHGIECIW